MTDGARPANPREPGPEPIEPACHPVPYDALLEEKTMFETKHEAGSALGLLVLRLAVGGMMLTHGWPKFERLLETPDRFADPFGVGPEVSLALAVFAELVCAGLIVLGALTRWAAVPLIVTMVTAAFIIHGDDPFGKKELALLYGSGALTLLLTGGGRLSVDGWWASRKAG